MMGLIDHPLTPKIVAWMDAMNKRAAYGTDEALRMEWAARDLLNAALMENASALQNAFDLGFKAAGGSIYPLNEDPSGQRREPMSPHPLDDEPPFEIQESK